MENAKKSMQISMGLATSRPSSPKAGDQISAQRIIIVLGQSLNQDGSAPQTLLERIKLALCLFKEGMRLYSHVSPTIA